MEENVIIASNIGALLDITNFANSWGEIVVILGCVDGYGSYSRVVIWPTFIAKSRDSIQGNIDPIIRICFFVTLMYLSARYWIRFMTSLPYIAFNWPFPIQCKCWLMPSFVHAICKCSEFKRIN